MPSYEDHIRLIADAARQNQLAEDALLEAEKRGHETRKVLDERRKALREFTNEQIADELGAVA